MDLHGAPRPVVALLRGTRTLALRLLGPFEGFVRLFRPAGPGPVPPLWLRRHTGAVSRVDEAARGTADLLAALSLVRPGARVLDAGCGFGVMAEPLARLFGPEGRYVGFDAHAPSIRWANRRLAAADPRLSFVEASAGGRFPAADGEADFLLAKSLFTHLPEETARGALREIARTLAPTGRAFVTAFLFEPDSPADVLFPYPAPGAAVLWRWRARPEAAIAFERGRFGAMVEEAVLTVETFRPGFWPGRDRLDAQDVLVLKRR